MKVAMILVQTKYICPYINIFTVFFIPYSRINSIQNQPKKSTRFKQLPYIPILSRYIYNNVYYLIIILALISTFINILYTLIVKRLSIIRNQYFAFVLHLNVLTMK